MKINDFLKKKRNDKGLSDSGFANLLDQNIHWVDDLNGDEDELNGLNIPQFKRMCDTLGISPQEVYSVVVSDLKDMNLFELIRKRREEKYWTIEDLSDRVGYDPSVIECLEGGTNLENICLDALKKIATDLELPFDLVLQKLEQATVDDS